MSPSLCSSPGRIICITTQTTVTNSERGCDISRSGPCHRQDLQTRQSSVDVDCRKGGTGTLTLTESLLWREPPEPGPDPIYLQFLLGLTSRLFFFPSTSITTPSTHQILSPICDFSPTLGQTKERLLLSAPHCPHFCRYLFALVRRAP